MKILFAPFKSAEEFLGRVEVADASATRVSVATKARFSPGEAVVLEISFPGLPNRVLVRTLAKTMPVADGLGLASFELTSGEDHKRDFLIAVAAGRGRAQALTSQRKNKRYPIRLPARFVADGEASDLPIVRGDAETDDVSSSGLFLKTARSLPEGARVTIILDPLDGSAEMEFLGRVVHTAEDGVGIQFDRPTGDELKRLRRIIRDVKLSGKMVEWETPAPA